MLRLLSWLFGFCIHDDEIVETHQMDSKWETAAKTGVTKVPVLGPSDTSQLLERKLVTIVRCKKCGRVKHITTTN